jgi:hypothetical protein
MIPPVPDYAASGLGEKPMSGLLSDPAMHVEPQSSMTAALAIQTTLYIGVVAGMLCCGVRATRVRDWL